MSKPVVAGAFGALIILAGAAAFFGFRALTLESRLKEVSGTIAEERAAAAAERDALAHALSEKTKESQQLADALARESRKTSSFEAQLRDLSGTVGVLEKLATTDAELLAKYSRVYFLNENYAPKALARIRPEFTLENTRVYELHADALPFLEQLLEDAADDGLTLLVASAYRSFATQAALKAGYQIRYGSGSNAFSADQGYSEHQLGTAVDFTTPAMGGAFSGFDTTEEYAWLADNAWRYGFILSYPSGNTFYQYEPWHWRFVGRALAEDLHDDEEHFYDLDQRTIDTYLVDLFD